VVESLDGQGDGEMGFADSWRSQQDDVLLHGKERQVEEFHDRFLAQMGGGKRSRTPRCFSPGGGRQSSLPWRRGACPWPPKGFRGAVRLSGASVPGSSDFRPPVGSSRLID